MGVHGERQVATKLPADLVKKLDDRAAKNLRDRAHEIRAILESALQEATA
jgi:metal-responsive CopG/Arc/MetJ family transcriptional regulator